MRKLILPILLLLLIIPMLFACGGNGEPNTHRIAIVENDGITVLGENPRDVADGESAAISVTLKAGYKFVSVSFGDYDAESGILTVRDVSRDMRIEFVTEAVDYDPNAVYTFYLTGGASAEASIPTATEIKAGSSVTVSATDESRRFIGWSFGSTITEGGEIVSTEREFTFSALPEYAVGERIVICPNYTSGIGCYYSANGGRINTNSENIKNKVYYTAKTSGALLEVSYKSEYFDTVDCISLFYDDASFTRDGYILKEYNTEADGSGDSYSLGSKMYTADEFPIIYCIWEKATPAEDFKTAGINIPSPVSLDKAPHWVENGVTITEYTGNAETVVIPEKIGGKYVTAISAGAFTNKNIKTLVMGRRILKIEDGAFVGCSSLETVYYPDGIYYITNGAFDAASYASFKNLYLNATTAPRYANTQEGAFARKFSRLLATENEKRVIVVAGSSAYQGLSTAYLEALLEDRTVINLGTTRTTNGLVYLDAIAQLADSNDIVLVAPENSAYMMGERELYWKTLRDIEGMINLWRYMDISNYENAFSALADFNERRFDIAPTRYEDIAVYGKYDASGKLINGMTRDGDCIRNTREDYCNDTNYTDSYVITLSDRIKSKFEVSFKDQSPNYNDPDDPEWCSFTDSRYADAMNRAFSEIKKTGALVYFAFAPVDADAVAPTADPNQYDKLIADTYTELSGVLGKSKNYIYTHKYFFDLAYHPNDYGRVIHTYRLYLDLAELLGKNICAIDSRGTDFLGCLFE